MKALQDANLPIPPAQTIRALIDTGASISAVDPSILSALGLQQTGEADIHTPSTAGTAVRTPTYDVMIGIYAARQNDPHFVSDTVQVTGSDLSRFGFSALIGTDILKECIFHYNGVAGLFTIAY